MEGRIFSVDYSPDGTRIAVGATLDGRGAVNLYAAQFDSTIPTNILATYTKTVGEYTKEEREAIEKFTTSEVKLLSSVTFSNAATYAVSFSPDGKRVAASGSDGIVHLIEVESGEITKDFPAAPGIDTRSEQAPTVASSAPLASAQ